MKPLSFGRNTSALYRRDPVRKQLECPCCGDYAAEPDDDDRWHASSELACGCNGRVEVKSCAPRVVIAKEGCDCR
jgi:hypothetical protein